MSTLKKLALASLILLGGGAFSGCYGGYYGAYGYGYGRGPRCVWVPGHYGPWGYHQGHYRCR